MTQTLAAAVLRATKGVVKFLIGREKHDPNNGEVSEIARLIQQSLEQDKMKEDFLSRQRSNSSPSPPKSNEEISSDTGANLLDSNEDDAGSGAEESQSPEPHEPHDNHHQIFQQQSNDQSDRQTELVLYQKQQNLIIDQLHSKLEDYEKQNMQMKAEMDRLKTRCTQLSQAEQQNTSELNSLKQTIKQMIDQYTELDKKFAENLNKLQLYEKR